MTETSRQAVLQFLRAELGVARAMTRDETVTFRFDPDPFDPLDIPYGTQISLPMTVNIRAESLQPYLRMRIDTATAWLRYRHDQVDYTKRPEGLASGPWAATRALEKARREVLFAQEYVGAAQNFLPHIQLGNRLSISNVIRLTDDTDAIAEGFYCAALFTLTRGNPLLAPAVRFLGKVWGDRIRKEAALDWTQLDAHMREPARFEALAMHASTRFWNGIGRNLYPASREQLAAAGLSPDEISAWTGKGLLIQHQQGATGQIVSLIRNQKAKVTPAPLALSPTVTNDDPAEGKRRKGRGRKHKPGSWKRFDRLLRGPGLSGFGPTPMDATSFVSLTETMELDEKDRPLYVNLFNELEAELVAELEETNNRRALKLGRPMWKGPTGSPIQFVEFASRRGRFADAYRKMRGNFEQVADVAALVKEEKLRELWAKLLKNYAVANVNSRRMARRLEQWLQAQTIASALPDCEEGRIDPSRLTRIVIDPTDENIHLGEQQVAHMDSAVTLLFDNSGSMKGKPLALAALLSRQIARALERSRVKCEVLGFTTKFDETERTHKALHIVVKSFNRRIGQSDFHFGIAADDDHIQGNADAEAVLWAADRLSQRPEARKILMVVSDAQPADRFIGSEFPGMGANSLLKSVAMSIEKAGEIELIGFGVGPSAHDVGYYYANSVLIKGMEQLGPALIDQLQKLLKSEATPKPRRVFRPRKNPQQQQSAG